MSYDFDRYRDGQIMAEGIRVFCAVDLPDAARRAALLADEGDVLVFKSADTSNTPPLGDAQ